MEISKGKSPERGAAAREVLDTKIHWHMSARRDRPEHSGLDFKAKVQRHCLISSDIM